MTFEWWKSNSFNKEKEKHRRLCYLSSTIASKRKKEVKYSTMKFSGGTLSILLAATAVAASVFQNNAGTTARNGIQARSFFGVNKSTSNQALVNGVSAVPRGGSSSDDSDNSEEEVPVDLYLPGLLGATVAKKAVSYYPFYLLGSGLTIDTYEEYHVLLICSSFLMQNPTSHL